METTLMARGAGAGRGSKRPYPTVVDAVPEFALIPKGELKVDHAYQRGLNEKRARRYAEDWSWAACGALKVALRPDGDWYVFDGQHRLAAALLRPDVTRLPCLVYEMATAQVEAEGFLSQATQRPMYSADRFKAQVIAGDPAAIVVNEIVTAAGMRVAGGTSPGGNIVSAVSELLRCVREDEATLRRLFPLLVEYSKVQKGILSEKFLRATFYLEREVPGALTAAARRKQLLTVPWTKFALALQSDTRTGETGSPRNLARRFLGAFNYGRRARLVVPGLNDAE